MKRLIALLLLVCLCLPLWGCTSREDENVLFYYLRKDLTYGNADGVLSGEERVLPSPANDGNGWMQLYLMGPLSEELYLPLPEGTQLTELSSEGGAWKLAFSPEFSALSSMELTLVCACISRTVFSLTDAETVSITAPASQGGTSVSFTADRETFLYYDDTTTAADAA